MFYGIRDNKVWDKCSKLINKRMKDNGVLTEADFYIELDDNSYVIQDSYNVETKTITKDSPLRSIEPEKTEIEKKLEELESRIETLESQLTLQSTKKL